jgi:hypothetical protein
MGHSIPELDGKSADSRLSCHTWCFYSPSLGMGSNVILVDRECDWERRTKDGLESGPHDKP